MVKNKNITKSERFLLGISGTLFMTVASINFLSMPARASSLCYGGCHLYSPCYSERNYSTPTAYIFCCRGTGTGNFMHTCAADNYYYSELDENGNCYPTGTCWVVYACTLIVPKDPC